jgi:anti-sigma regulatory factor (Ser/Thr protein kinase)
VSARAFLRDRALRAGVRAERAVDLCYAVNEVLTNALVHGSTPAVSAWLDDGRFVCQIEDRGHGIVDPLAGYLPPATDAVRGRGLWLARQLVDLLQIVPGRLGTTVRLQVRRSGS